VDLRAYLIKGGPLFASRIAAVELRRAVRRHDNRAAIEQSEQVLGALRMIELDDQMSVAAGEMEPVSLRALDAAHLSAALALGDECTAFISYDARLNAAARAVGLQVRSPGA
jgi:uncharacterized protein